MNNAASLGVKDVREAALYGLINLSARVSRLLTVVVCGASQRDVYVGVTERRFQPDSPLLYTGLFLAVVIRPLHTR